MNENKRSITELGDPSNPHGEAGAEMLAGMNERHSPVTSWAISFFELSAGDRVLDIGCGGGETLHKLAEMLPDGQFTGLDHSELSVRISSEHNQSSINDGRMNIVQGSVEELPFREDSFNRIITVESFYFWPDPAENLKEVCRVLDRNGQFLIVADIHGGAELSDEDLANIRKYGLFNPTPGELEELLHNAGFSQVCIHTRSDKTWICAEARK
ncbi:MAG: methyltransferase domain-containing protein [Ruminococcus sp.]|nr:methyltransferase domain-containing protein [Ruminococcus sp.]